MKRYTIRDTAFIKHFIISLALTPCHIFCACKVRRRVGGGVHVRKICVSLRPSALSNSSARLNCSAARGPSSAQFVGRSFGLSHDENNSVRTVGPALRFLGCRPEIDGKISGKSNERELITTRPRSSFSHGRDIPQSRPLHPLCDRQFVHTE